MKGGRERGREKAEGGEREGERESTPYIPTSHWKLYTYLSCPCLCTERTNTCIEERRRREEGREG